jgi:hypothetical protein
VDTSGRIAADRHNTASQTEGAQAGPRTFEQRSRQKSQLRPVGELAWRRRLGIRHIPDHSKQVTPEARNRALKRTFGLIFKIDDLED